MNQKPQSITFFEATLLLLLLAVVILAIRSL